LERGSLENAPFLLSKPRYFTFDQNISLSLKRKKKIKEEESSISPVCFYPLEVFFFD
jgi:hypothetical protein